jgi:hypothetical protein
MRTENIYLFEELSSEAKKFAIEQNRNWDYSYILEECMNDHFKEIVGEIADDLKMSYSLSCCQGDGVSLTGEVTDLQNLANMVYDGNVPHNVARIIKYVLYSVKFSRSNHHYVHKYTVDIEAIDNYNMDCTNIGKHDRIFAVMAQFEADVKEWYYEVCNKLEHYGYEAIDGFTEDEYIADMLIANECEFLADGRPF